VTDHQFRNDFRGFSRANAAGRVDPEAPPGELVHDHRQLQRPAVVEAIEGAFSKNWAIMLDIQLKRIF
jgi:hypothetical protein